ncbi:Uncharacterised protein [Candidatus Tiddalikarchaeum anstoanum]|nr:Uncharacterised protein [Candidatus Tiddalikarchaeum anstoanum]
MDNDGDLDITATSPGTNTVAWWENHAIVGKNGPCCGDDGILDNFRSYTNECINGTVI